MYQSIDDPQDNQSQSGTPRWRRKSLWAGALIMAAIAAALLASRSAAPDAALDTFAAQKASYRTAISEGAAPMRRARLQDFIAVHPHSRYNKAAQAQLDVINAHEAARWRDVTNSVYDTRLTPEEKAAALDTFERDWGAALLGGRAKEIEQIRQEITAAQDTPKTPDRMLEEGPSPISDTIEDTELAGAYRPAPRTPIAVATPVPTPQPIITLAVIAPKVRRNVEPSYPRKAQRRKVEGVVTLKLNIDEKGKVAMAELVSASAERYEKSFIKAAERAALRTRYHPKTIGGKPVAASGITKVYRFTMGE